MAGWLTTKLGLVVEGLVGRGAGQHKLVLALGGGNSLEVHFQPGRHLSEDKLAALHRDLNVVANDRAIPIHHKVVDGPLPHSVLQEQYGGSVVGLIYKQSEPAAFLFSPMFHTDNGLLLAHAGLVVSRGKGVPRTVELLSLGGICIMRRNGHSSYYVTNVSNAPSIVELFTRSVRNVWPSPLSNLRRPPRGYREVFRVLEKEYLCPNLVDARTDQRRFVVSSSSSSMGFEADPFKLRPPADFRFLAFCHSWIDYEKQEDLVQVGRLEFFDGLLREWLLYGLSFWYRFRSRSKPTTPLDKPGRVPPPRPSAPLQKNSNSNGSFASPRRTMCTAACDGGGSAPRTGMDYSRNWLFIDPPTQERLANCRVLVAGLGIGSVFCETALRTGINSFTICDGDVVDASNLNRQNYEHADVGLLKANQTAARLRRISPAVQLNVVASYLDAEDLDRLVPEHDFVVNTIDFDTPAFEACSAASRRHQKTELFPINLGFGCALTVLDSGTPCWRDQFRGSAPLKDQILDHIANSGQPPPYLLHARKEYQLGRDSVQAAQLPRYDPQLCISTQLASGMMMSAIVNLLQGESVPRFPQFQYVDAAAPRIF
jgi:molybdopterin-synthase adenylyltransferase